MTLQQLWTRGQFVRAPNGTVGMVRAFDRRTNMVSVVSVGAGGVVQGTLLDGLRANKVPDDIVDQLRVSGIVHDHHFATLRVGEQPA